MHALRQTEHELQEGGVGEMMLYENPSFILGLALVFVAVVVRHRNKSHLVFGAGLFLVFLNVVAAVLGVLLGGGLAVSVLSLLIAWLSSVLWMDDWPKFAGWIDKYLRKGALVR